jgi:hypothetical protein
MALIVGPDLSWFALLDDKLKNGICLGLKFQVNITLANYTAKRGLCGLKKRLVRSND